MNRRARWLPVVGLAALFAVPGLARHAPGETPELDRARDPLIDRIVAGERFDEAVAAYKALVEQRDLLIPTSYEAKQVERERVRNRHAFDREWSRSADHEVAWRCRMSVDPKKFHPMVDGWKGDWGKVTRKQTVRLEPRNALDPGEEWTVYEVEGQRRTYRFKADRMGRGQRKQFRAEKGELVFVCDGGTDAERRLPEEWRENFQRSGFAFRLGAPPKIVEKAKWNPIHITDNALYWAVKDVRWKFPADAHVLSVIDVMKDLGDGHFLVDLHTHQRVSMVVEVPRGVKNRELILPDHKVFAIMGNARFDKERRALVLTVVDVESSYVSELPEPGEED